METDPAIIDAMLVYLDDRRAEQKSAELGARLRGQTW